MFLSKQNVKRSVTDQNMERVINLCRPMIEKAINGIEFDIKQAVDTAFRDILHEFIQVIAY